MILNINRIEYYNDTSTCHYSCNTRFGLQYNQCVTCPTSSNRLFQSSSNTCLCDTNYQDNGVDLCVSICDISCFTCSAAGNTNCLSCDSTKHRTNLSSGSCPCYSGYNDTLDPGNTCVVNYRPCHYSCYTCYGQLDTNCLTCSSTNFMTMSANSCPCDNGYIDLSIPLCRSNYNPCFYSCLTCFGASETQCLTCQSTRKLIINLIGINQTCICEDGTFNNLVAKCAACDSTCKTCTAAGSNSCQSCETTIIKFFSYNLLRKIVWKNISYVPYEFLNLEIRCQSFQSNNEKLSQLQIILIPQRLKRVDQIRINQQEELHLFQLIHAK